VHRLSRASVGTCIGWHMHHGACRRLHRALWVDVCTPLEARLWYTLPFELVQGWVKYQGDHSLFILMATRYNLAAFFAVIWPNNRLDLPQFLDQLFTSVTNRAVALFFCMWLVDEVCTLQNCSCWKPCEGKSVSAWFSCAWYACIWLSKEEM